VSSYLRSFCCRCYFDEFFIFLLGVFQDCQPFAFVSFVFSVLVEILCIFSTK